MQIKAQLSFQKNNPQIPLNVEDAIRVIVEFPLPEKFVDFIREIQGTVFGLDVGGVLYKAVAYSSTEKTQPIKLTLHDPESSPAIVTFIMHVYMPIEDAVKLKRSGEVIIKTN